ncbi:MAG: hypothetical protein JWM98_3111 [Thermoleophilia bacterium]|nr:hypothetical protein [Thermoleophilia bacterium]
MTSLAARIDDIAAAARSARMGPAEAVAELATLAQARGGRSGRRDDGAFFTDADVARHLVRRAIAMRLLDAAGVDDDDLDRALAEGADLHGMLASRCADPDARRAAVATLGQLVVLDPSCGAGSFLVEAWSELVAVAALLGAGEGAVSPAQLHGVDVDAEAIAACRAVLDIVVAGDDPRTPSLQVGDAQCADVLPPADIVVGNPPFVRATAGEDVADLGSAPVPNRSAWIVERALAAARPGARAAFVLPISTACTDAFAPARASWSAACDRVFSSHFDAIPSSLFRGVVQRLTLLEGCVRADPPNASPSVATRWYTSRYHRWTHEERAGLLDRVRHEPLPPQDVGGSLAKVGTPIEARLLEALFRHPPAGRLLLDERSPDAPNRVLYKRRWSYYLLFTMTAPPMWGADGQLREPSELRVLPVDPRVDARALLAVFSSSLFWWFFSVFTDNRNVNRRDLAAFPLPLLDAAAIDRLTSMGEELQRALEACAEVRTCTYRSVGTIHNTYYRQGETRPVLDRIDTELARLYGLDAAQRDFVVGYERRFRA